LSCRFAPLSVLNREAKIADVYDLVKSIKKYKIMSIIGGYLTLIFKEKQA
jgi:hypothetical protein